MKPNTLSGLVLAWALVVLAGCSSHPKKVDCEAHLQPINAPAPKSPEGQP
jgi:hypothetical protein